MVRGRVQLGGSAGARTGPVPDFAELHQQQMFIHQAVKMNPNGASWQAKAFGAIFTTKSLAGVEYQLEQLLPHRVTKGGQGTQALGVVEPCMCFGDGLEGWLLDRLVHDCWPCPFIRGVMAAL